MNDRWKGQFPPWILERGRTCHQMGRVHRLTHHGREISALVEGTKLYHVAVRFSAGIPESASCDCPYASGGQLCKHMAALLFALEAMDYVPANDPDNLSWEDAIRELPPDTLRIVLRNLAETDESLRQLLLRLYEMQLELTDPEETFHS